MDSVLGWEVLYALFATGSTGGDDSLKSWLSRQLSAADGFNRCLDRADTDGGEAAATGRVDLKWLQFAEGAARGKDLPCSPLGQGEAVLKAPSGVRSNTTLWGSWKEPPQCGGNQWAVARHHTGFTSRLWMSLLRTLRHIFQAASPAHAAGKASLPVFRQRAALQTLFN